MKGKQCCGNCRYFKSIYPDHIEQPIAVVAEESTAPVGNNRRTAMSYLTDSIGGFGPTPDICRLFPLPHTAFPDGWCGQWQAENPDTTDTVVLALARATLAGDLTAGRALVDKFLEMEAPSEPDSNL